MIERIVAPWVARSMQRRYEGARRKHEIPGQRAMSGAMAAI